MDKNKFKIAFAADHAGFSLKEILKTEIATKVLEIKDFGTFSDKSTDYADFAHPLALAVESGDYDFGISICGSGNGINMTANKHQGIRAALCWNVEIAQLARQHNNANICSIPARFVATDAAKAIMAAFLATEFEGGRHQRRIEKMAVDNVSK